MARDEYDDYADAVSPTSERTRTQTRTHAGGGPFLGKLWAKFNALPAQTKVLILGAIVVVGIVIYLNVKGKSAAAADNSNATVTQIPGNSPNPQPNPNPNPPMPGAQPPVPIYPINPYGLSGGPGGINNNPGNPPTTTPGQNGPTGIISRPAAKTGTGGDFSNPMRWPRARAYPGTSWPL